MDDKVGDNVFENFEIFRQYYGNVYYNITIIILIIFLHYVIAVWVRYMNVFFYLNYT